MRFLISLMIAFFVSCSFGATPVANLKLTTPANGNGFAFTNLSGIQLNNDQIITNFSTTTMPDSTRVVPSSSAVIQYVTNQAAAGILATNQIAIHAALTEAAHGGIISTATCERLIGEAASTGTYFHALTAEQLVKDGYTVSVTGTIVTISWWSNTESIVVTATNGLGYNGPPVGYVFNTPYFEDITGRYWLNDPPWTIYDGSGDIDNTVHWLTGPDVGWSAVEASALPQKMTPYVGGVGTVTIDWVAVQFVRTFDLSSFITNVEQLVKDGYTVSVTGTVISISSWSNTTSVIVTATNGLGYNGPAVGTLFVNPVYTTQWIWDAAPFGGGNVILDLANASPESIYAPGNVTVSINDVGNLGVWNGSGSIPLTIDPFAGGAVGTLTLGWATETTTNYYDLNLFSTNGHQHAYTDITNAPWMTTNSVVFTSTTARISSLESNMIRSAQFNYITSLTASAFAALPVTNATWLYFIEE